jgi:hypothetical protein
MEGTVAIIVRDVFQAKYGKGDELVALFKEAQEKLGLPLQRIMTDASGQFFTVVTEREVASLAEWESMMPKLFADPRFGPWFQQMTALVEGGRREFYNVVPAGSGSTGAGARRVSSSRGRGSR